MRGFLGGTLLLAMLSVLVRSDVADKLQLTSNLAVRGFQRFYDPTVAGVPKAKSRATTSGGNTLAPWTKDPRGNIQGSGTTTTTPSYTT